MIMVKLLALVGAVALLAACMHAPQATAKAEQAEEAAVIAASLGFHGPGGRPVKAKGN